MLLPIFLAGKCRSGECAPPQALLNHPTTPCSLEACKLAEPQTVQDETPIAASAPASVLLARPHAQSCLAQKLAPFRPMVERSVEQSVPPAGSRPRDFATARFSMALMHASASAGVVGEKRSASSEGFVETDAMSRVTGLSIVKSNRIGVEMVSQATTTFPCVGIMHCRIE